MRADFIFESLPSRTLFAAVINPPVFDSAARPPEVIPTGDHVFRVLQTAQVSVNAKGTLSIISTDLNDDITVRRNGFTISVVLTSKLPDVGSQATFTARWAFDSREIKSVVVDGGEGVDGLHVDAATQPITNDRSVEERVLVRSGHRYVRDIPSTPLPGVYAGDTALWLQRSAARIAAAPRAGAAVALLGDSMMDYFDQTGAASFSTAFGDHAVDLGLPGDTTSQLLYRIEHQGLLDGMSPEVVVLNIGTNNVTLSGNDEAIARGVAAVVTAVRERLPTAKILLTSVLPQHAQPQDRVINRLNDRLAALADGTTVRFLRATDSFSSPRAAERLYRPGSIHLNARGYGVWASLIGPAVAGLRADF